MGPPIDGRLWRLLIGFAADEMVAFKRPLLGADDRVFCNRSH